MPSEESILLEKIPVTKKTATGKYGIRMLSIDHTLIEEYKFNFMKSGIIQIDPESVRLGFPWQVCIVGDLQRVGRYFIR